MDKSNLSIGSVKNTVRGAIQIWYVRMVSFQWKLKKIGALIQTHKLYSNHERGGGVIEAWIKPLGSMYMMVYLFYI